MISLRKQLTLYHATGGFSLKWTLRNKCRNSILMSYHYPDLGVLLIGWKSASSNQKHYPDLGCDTSLVRYTQNSKCWFAWHNNWQQFFSESWNFVGNSPIHFLWNFQSQENHPLISRIPTRICPQDKLVDVHIFTDLTGLMQAIQLFRELTICIPVSVQFLSLYLYKI